MRIIRVENCCSSICMTVGQLEICTFSEIYNVEFSTVLGYKIKNVLVKHSSLNFRQVSIFQVKLN